jgi:hypothetical protein
MRDKIRMCCHKVEKNIIFRREKWFSGRCCTHVGYLMLILLMRGLTFFQGIFIYRKFYAIINYFQDVPIPALYVVQIYTYTANLYIAEYKPG